MSNNSNEVRGRLLAWVPYTRCSHSCWVVVSGWVHRRQLIVIEFLQAENRQLKERLRGKRIRFGKPELHQDRFSYPSVGLDKVMAKIDAWSRGYGGSACNES